jgi:hypothetical protein
MRAFVCEGDHRGLRQFGPEHLLPSDELAGLARVPFQRSSTIVSILLEEHDAEALRTEIGAGRRCDANNLLLNRAFEILPMAVAIPNPNVIREAPV